MGSHTSTRLTRCNSSCGMAVYIRDDITTSKIPFDFPLPTARAPSRRVDGSQKPTLSGWQPLTPMTLT